MTQLTPDSPLVTLPGERGERPAVRGKFLFRDSEKFYVRGTTYGTFAYESGGSGRYEQSVVERDFARMAEAGLNAIRTYTVPPIGMLDSAQRNGLSVMVGLPWEQHVAFLDDARVAASIERRVREGVRRCAGHPAVLAYAVGNEIPASIVRWLGRHRVEHFIERLVGVTRDEDPQALVTYVNYPTTEYLQLPFLDVACFNVYLERPATLAAYLARLQNLSGDRPLIMAEVGLDSRRNGELLQAEALRWQLQSIFAAGCAGAFAFAWTDEWHRGGFPVDDWDFGLVRRDRSAKPALAAVREAFSEVPFRAASAWPRVSVVVCAYNAGTTIRECLEGVRGLNYPNYETIVVDDGSTDGTGRVAAEYGVRVIATENRGLSSARNTAWRAATGEIVAYLDSDAFPDPDWLRYLAQAFVTSSYAGIGGPNVAPAYATGSAECFDLAPGGPVHVLLSDVEAEHIPGCNMAFRRAELERIGGFDPDLRVAGDDVDACWRLIESGATLGYSPGALVWHHRRTTLRGYWKQQRGYGRAEALLERKWPEKYNALGHVTWGGRIYANGLGAAAFRRQRLYGGVWGTAPYQALESAQPSVIALLSAMPEWYLVIAALAALSACGILWRPLLAMIVPLLVAAALPLGSAVAAARKATFRTHPASAADNVWRRGLVAFLQVVQPLARLSGRIEYGLTCWRTGVTLRIDRALPRRVRLWNERWQETAARLEAFERTLREGGAVVARGGPYDRWDIEVRGGALGSGRVLTASEEHGSGRQLVLMRTWPAPAAGAAVSVVALSLLALGAGVDHAWAACGVLAATSLAVILRSLQECATALQRIDAAAHVLGQRI